MWPRLQLDARHPQMQGSFLFERGPKANTAQRLILQLDTTASLARAFQIDDFQKPKVGQNCTCFNRLMTVFDETPAILTYYRFLNIYCSTRSAATEKWNWNLYPRRHIYIHRSVPCFTVKNGVSDSTITIFSNYCGTTTVPPFQNFWAIVDSVVLRQENKPNSVLTLRPF